jgi:hypothetical protein
MIPTMIVLGIWYEVIGVAISYVLASVIQAVYYVIMSKKWDKENNIEK